MQEPAGAGRRRWVALGLVLIAPFVLHLLGQRPPRNHTFVERGLVWATLPLESSVTWVWDKLASLAQQYVLLVAVGRENDALRVQVGRLQGQVLRLQEAAAEGQRLRGLLALGTSLEGAEGHGVVARVVGAAPTALFRSLRIDRGRAHGVKLGHAVISTQGLVGRIVALGEQVADVLLLVDANSSVDCLVQRSRAHIRLRGDGGERAIGLEAESLARAADVEPGDLLVTSGLGGTFPKGLSVGRVRGVERRAFGLYQRAIVYPSVAGSPPEEVLVIETPGALALETLLASATGAPACGEGNEP